uniref:Uncharacterized protein n=1 Tax=Attheya septentrionalis TaxID=420275 RepID=A0A7S2UIB2_9STRA|mmetsp:Transcript_24339/g.44016  ORF Transcript_24339/g.44016 Transcript_24339/m.44016 type:complete len:460 (+) Transcript_24339:285-1664(+)
MEQRRRRKRRAASTRIRPQEYQNVSKTATNSPKTMLAWAMLLLVLLQISLYGNFQRLDPMETLQNRKSSSKEGATVGKNRRSPELATIRATQILAETNNKWRKEELPLVIKEAARTNKTHLLDILLEANVTVTLASLKKLPTWEDVTDLYGDTPLISGLDSCKAFRQSIPLAQRIVAPAGLYNSGTNLMAVLLKENCRVESFSLLPRSWYNWKHYEKRGGKKNKHVRVQVPWGKHSPASWRNQYEAPSMGMPTKDHLRVLPVVTIKDPFSWMGSTCRNPYDVTWPHSYPDNCPNLVAKHTHFFGEEGNKGNDSNNHVNRNNDGIAVEVRRSKDSITHHESLAHLWNDWYSEYYDPIESFPRIMVRYEDLLFHTQEVISKVCTTCMGGTIPYKKVKLLPTSAKLASAHKSRTGLLEAMIHYGSAKRRLEGFTRDDVIFANQHLNTDLMTTFGYPLAPSKQ